MIDTLVLVIADQGAGKSNQIRSVFEEAELHGAYGGYPTSANIRRNYAVHPDVDLLVRLSSWHERGESYAQVKADLKAGHVDPVRRYKVIAPAQVTATPKLMAGEDLFIRLHADFNIRRSYAVWLHPNVAGNNPFAISPSLASFLSANRSASALGIDSAALHPSASPAQNSINARLLGDLLFRT
ncbi:hypothetical protein [Brevundimonas sp.]|uniref:hypothetical protein n=1 Tax=Brevundimonas sp. TaxID=1871086 RepID=UPI003D6D25EB